MKIYEVSYYEAGSSDLFRLWFSSKAKAKKTIRDLEKSDFAESIGIFKRDMKITKKGVLDFLNMACNR